MTPQPPHEFVSELRRFDPLLRVRWAHRTKQWVVERKMPERHKQLVSERPNPWKSARGWDIYDGWREGYVHVLSVPLGMLDRRVFDVLAEADTHRQGGMKKMADKLDEMDAQEESAVDKQTKGWVKDATSDAYDRLKWLQGERVALNTPEPPLVDSGLGFKVRDNRGASQDA